MNCYEAGYAPFLAIAAKLLGLRDTCLLLLQFGQSLAVSGAWLAVGEEGGKKAHLYKLDTSTGVWGSTVVKSFAQGPRRMKISSRVPVLGYLA